MEMETPDWLNKAFLVSALQQESDDINHKVTVDSFSATLAVPAGNNFTSHLYRVKVEYRVEKSTLQKTSLIVKAPLTTGLISTMSDRLDLMSTEPKVYKELLPKMYEKLDFKFAANTYSCHGLKNGLVLQDLEEDGYILSNRLKQLDFSHCKVAVTALARFHATSVAVYKDDPDFIKTIGKERLYNEDGVMTKEWKPWMKACIGIITGKVADIEGCKPAVDYFTSKVDELTDSLIITCKPKENGLNVLNHGDFWLGNMLFKHNDSGEAVDVKFVDFQIMRYASPALDLVYFLWSSANDDVRAHRQQEFFNVYLETLNSTFEELCCEERLSEEELKQDLIRSTVFAVPTICNLLPVILCEPEDVVKSEDMKEEDIVEGPDEKYLKIYHGKTFTDALPKVMTQFAAWLSS